MAVIHQELNTMFFRGNGVALCLLEQGEFGNHHFVATNLPFVFPNRTRYDECTFLRRVFGGMPSFNRSFLFLYDALRQAAAIP